MPLPLLKSCLVLVGSDCGKARLSKRLSNSAAKPKSHFPHRPAPGFSRQLGQARGNPDLIRAVHAPSPALVCLSLLEMSGKFFQAISVHPGVLAGLGGKVRDGRSGCGRESQPFLAETLDQAVGSSTPGQGVGAPGPLQQAAVLRSSHAPSRSELAATTPSEHNR